MGRNTQLRDSFSRLHIYLFVFIYWSLLFVSLLRYLNHKTDTGVTFDSLMENCIQISCMASELTGLSQLKQSKWFCDLLLNSILTVLKQAYCDYIFSPVLPMYPRKKQLLSIKLKLKLLKG